MTTTSTTDEETLLRNRAGRYRRSQEADITDGLMEYGRGNQFAVEDTGAGAAEWQAFRAPFVVFFQRPKPQWGNPAPWVFPAGDATRARAFTDDYKMQARETGHGGFGSVHECTRIADNEKFAVKVINKLQLFVLKKHREADDEKTVEMDIREHPDYKSGGAPRLDKMVRRAAGVYGHVRFEVEILKALKQYEVAAAAALAAEAARTGTPAAAPTTMHHFLRLEDAYEDVNDVHVVTEKYPLTLKQAVLTHAHKTGRKDFLHSNDAGVLRVVHELLFILLLLDHHELLHLDLKPSNLMMTAPIKAGGHVKVIDLGAAVKAHEARQQNPSVHSPPWSAPEQTADWQYRFMRNPQDLAVTAEFEIKISLTHKSDVYAMGQILKWMLSLVYKTDYRQRTEEDVEERFALAWDETKEKAKNAHLVRLLDRMTEEQAKDRPAVAEFKNLAWMPARITDEDVEAGMMKGYNYKQAAKQKGGGFRKGYDDSGAWRRMCGGQREKSGQVPRALYGPESTEYLAFLHQQNAQLGRENRHLKRQLRAVSHCLDDAEEVLA